MPRKPTDAMAKVFWSGRSQAIRIPQEYRLSCREVRIHRDGRNLVLEPVEEETDENGWSLRFLEFFRAVEPDERLDLGDRTKKPERGNPLT